MKHFTLNGYAVVDYGDGGEQSEICLVGWELRPRNVFQRCPWSGSWDIMEFRETQREWRDTPARGECLREAWNASQGTQEPSASFCSCSSLAKRCVPLSKSFNLIFIIYKIWGLKWVFFNSKLLVFVMHRCREVKWISVLVSWGCCNKIS